MFSDYDLSIKKNPVSAQITIVINDGGNSMRDKPTANGRQPMMTTMPPDTAAAYAELNLIVQAFTNVVVVGVRDEKCFGHDLTED